MLARKTMSGRAALASFAALPVLACGPMLACKGNETAALSLPGPSQLPPPSSSAPAAGPRPDASFVVGYSRGCPDWMVRIGDSPEDYCIDRFEDHLVELRNGFEKVHPPAVRPRNSGLIARSAPGVFPQSSIDQLQASQACRNAGKRLCTLHEWKRACMGVRGYTYPYGDKEMTGMCNTRKPHLVSMLFGNDNKKWTRSDMNDPVLNSLQGYLAKSGEYSSCVSSYGVYDMVGNLHEWVSDIVDAGIMGSMPYIGKSKPTGGPTAAVGNGIFMGGFYSSGNQNGEGCNYMTIAHPPQHYDYSTGFRCCKGAEELH
jgi:sulfatase modifying factor 1